MTELQSDDVVIKEEVIHEDAPQEPEKAPSELAAEETKTEEQKPTGSVDGLAVEGPDGFKKAINKQHFKFREEQRRNQELQKRIEELEAKNAPKIDEVTDVPPIPDSFDEDYERKIQERDAAIKRNAQAEAAKNAQEADRINKERERQRQELERSEQLNNEFMQRANDLGVNPQALSSAQNAVIQYGITPELADTLLKDDLGPLMVQYLEANPLELSDIVNSPPMQAGLLLAEVKSKSAELKPKTETDAPPPPTSISGKGVVVNDGLEGVTYE